MHSSPYVDINLLSNLTYTINSVSKMIIVDENLKYTVKICIIMP